MIIYTNTYSCLENSGYYFLFIAKVGGLAGMLEVGEGPPTPPWLQAIISSIREKDYLDIASLKEDIFIAVLFVLVHEVGFTACGLDQKNPGSSFNIRILRKLSNLNSVIRRESSYHVPLSLYNCPEPCELVLVPNSNIFIVNFHIPNVETFSISYNVNNFISFGSDSTPKFSNLNILSTSFKDVCHKFRNAVLDHVNLPSLHITKIPYEILLKISTYLDPRSFVYLSVTCKQFLMTLNQDEFIWRRLFKIHFKTDSVPSISCTWKKHFIDETKNKSLSHRVHRCESMPYIMNLSPHLYFMRLPRI